MIIPTIINIWDMMDLIFRKSYQDVILSSTFKLILLAKNNNLQIAVPYWELCNDEYDIDYIELDAIQSAPYYDEYTKCFIFKNIDHFFQSIEAIQLQLMKLYPINEEHIYRHFISNAINNEIQNRRIMNSNEYTKKEDDLSNLLNQMAL